MIDPFEIENYEIEPSHTCEHEGCDNPAVACWLPEAFGFIEVAPGAQPDNWYCGTHAPTYGYCSGCGDFWGGIESFELSGLCDACKAELDHERELEDWDYTDDPE